MIRAEKQFIAAMLIFCTCIGGGVAYISYAIKEAGGIKQIIIDTGKEIKEIKKEIDKDT